MIKMKGEIPVFRRCCFCLPLRYGLLAWGYFKMIADVLLIFFIGCTIVQILFFMAVFAKDNLYKIYPELIISLIAITLFFADFIVTILFIVGGHKKNVQLIRVFYFLSMGMWVATLLLTTFTIVMTIKDYVTYSYSSFFSNVVLSSCFYFVSLAVQTYVILLLRSEIIKLSNIGEFRFVNNAAEAECTMRCEEVIVATEAVKPDN